MSQLGLAPDKLYLVTVKDREYPTESGAVRIFSSRKDTRDFIFSQELLKNTCQMTVYIQSPSEEK